MLNISTWTLENQAPVEPKDLPNAFLQRLWLLSPDARNPCCKLPYDAHDDANKSPETLSDFGGENQCVINPLDLVTAVFMSCNTFLQQEITLRMVQCQFAVPLVLPNIDPEEPSQFLLWSLRGVVGHWRSHFPDKNKKVQEGDLPSTYMPMVSCVKLGQCGVSKSQVLNHLISGLKSCNEIFLHRGMDGGQLPQRVSSGLVEIAWYRPTGDTAKDVFPVPLVISNLRGDASTHKKCLSLLCQASSAVVVFCGNLRETDKQLLSSCNDMASKLILIDLSDTEKNENGVVGFDNQNPEGHMELPQVSVLQGGDLSVEELANRLCVTLKNLLPDKMKLVTLEAAAKLAVELGLKVDEGSVCKNAMATVEEMLKGLDEGSAQFREKQLPLQGPLLGKLAEIEKEESKHKKDGKEINLQLQKEKKDILAELSSYKMTPAMKMFTDVLCTTDKVRRTYFLTWMKLKLQQKQTEKQNSPQDLFTNVQSKMIDEQYNQLENGVKIEDSASFCRDLIFKEETTEGLPVNTEVHVFSTDRGTEPQQKKTHYLDTEQQLTMMSNKKEIQGDKITLNKVCFEQQILGPVFKGQNQQGEPVLTKAISDLTSFAKQQTNTDSTFEDQEASCSQLFKPDPSWLGLEHFLREMGLIFELKHISSGSGSHNVLRLPNIAADLLFYGIPLEVMDGDASTVPIHWLRCVFAELKRRLPQQQCRTRVLTNLGVYHARNAEVLSALFGVKFPGGRKRPTRGVYMIVLCLPENLRKDMEFEILLLIDVEGLCLVSPENNINTHLHDNQMASIATGLSDVLLQNISSHAGSELEDEVTVIVNALLCIKEYGTMPICEIITQDEGINSLLQASQLRRVTKMLQAEPRDSKIDKAEDHYAQTSSCITCVKGPWSNFPLSEPWNEQYSETVLTFKKKLFSAMKACATKSEAPGLPEFITHLCAVWDAVKAESFSIGLQNTDIALAFSLMCTEHFQWEDSILKHMESWLMRSTQKHFAAKALDFGIQNRLLSELKDEARDEVKTEVDKLRSKVEAYLIKDDILKMYTKTFKPILMCNMDDFEEHTTKEIIQRLDTVNESQCSSTQLSKFETLLKTEQESKLHELVEQSKLTKTLPEDSELEEAFDDVWTKTLSNFDFRSSETDNITVRVTEILKENLISRRLQKHMKKLEVISQNQTSSFQVTDEYFGYRSRLKHMFEDNNRLQRLQAQQVVWSITEEYNQFVADKTRLPADFSDSYIKELLEKVEKVLVEKSMEIRTAFEVELKVYLCSAACQDFQKIHDRYAKDSALLMSVTAKKSTYLAEFIYQFRKKDQCQRVAQAFTSMVVKPTVLDYIYRPLGMHIAEELEAKEQLFQSPRAFHQSLLEELIKEDSLESFQEYLLSFDSFRMKKIQERVIAHLSESNNLAKWRQHRLGEIIGKIAAAVSQASEGTGGWLTDTKPMLERVCITLELDRDVHIRRTPLDGPVFSITTEWDRFVTCLMELLASMRLEFAQEFSQNVDITQILQCLPVQPQHYIFSKVRGCDKRCPLCRAPCEVEEIGHEIHRARLHRPKVMLLYDSSSLSSDIYPASLTQGNSDRTNDAQDTYFACRDLHFYCLDWNNSPEDRNRQALCVYWRY